VSIGLLGSAQLSLRENTFFDGLTIWHSILIIVSHFDLEWRLVLRKLVNRETICGGRFSQSWRSAQLMVAGEHFVRPEDLPLWACCDLGWRVHSGMFLFLCLVYRLLRMLEVDCNLSLVKCITGVDHFCEVFDRQCSARTIFTNIERVSILHLRVSDSPLLQRSHQHILLKRRALGEVKAVEARLLVAHHFRFIFW